LYNLFFSTFVHSDGMDSPLYDLLTTYMQRSSVQVHLRVGSWIDGWTTLYGYALSRSGPDVSEVGSTWVGDLVRMRALAPFTKSDEASIVGGSPFIEKTWLRLPDGTCYSIPWSVDLRMIFYRRDLLQQAGVDEATAFQDLPHFLNTLACLRDRLGSGPLAIPTVRSRNALQTMATWVWGAGGDFVGEDESLILFDQPAALEGARAFFALKPYLCERAYQPGYRADTAFTTGNAAVLISGSWILKLPGHSPLVRENLGVAALPGQAFVGGSQLVFWDYCRQRELALGLIRFLHEPGNIPALYPWVGLPVREMAWEQQPFSQHPFSTVLQSIKTGRGFSTSQVWGLVEKRLIDTITAVWQDGLSSEAGSCDIEHALIELGARLRPTLARQ
jgi:multiple sugar transport system substrate-binding protein